MKNSGEKRYKIFYSDAVNQDLPRITTQQQKIIARAIQEKLGTQPEIFGKPLKHSLHPLRSLRVGDFRVIFELKKDKVEILGIMHRSVVYKEIKKRSA